jgi:hypothetical protein
MGNRKKWSGTRKNEREAKKMNLQAKKWFGAQKNEFARKKMARNEKK